VKKILIILLFFQTQAYSQNFVNVYFAGGCFWCMEESFEKTEGVIKVISGYSGGTTKNPTYKEVTYGNTGHFETVKITYDSEIISYNKILDIYWKNIDPFDAIGQFCDKGYSYRSVAFYQNDEERKLIQKDVKDLENKFNKKVVTYIRNFEKFYKAEEYHQDFYKIKLERYLRYKKACGREETLRRIWSQ